MKQHFFKAVRLTVFTVVLLTVVYPSVLWMVAQITPDQGAGELITRKGKTYYANVGQLFTEKSYFWSRPSAVDYNASGSGGSNKGPSNKEYLATVQSRIDTFLAENPGVKKSDLPVELVTASGSGLDPNISPQAARIQVSRVAKARGLDESGVSRIVEQNIEKPLFGVFGPEKINVLKLNLALDNLQ